MRRISALLLTIFLIPLTGIQSAFSVDFALGDLSNVGKQGIEDLTRCINSKKAVDIYYLIDKSGSLNGTDPERNRANIIGQSIRTLAGFKGVKVDYAVGFFGDNFEPWKSWTSVTDSNAESESKAVENRIKTSRPNDWDTNWQVGVAGAQELLQKKRSSGNACQALIWLTDGGIWIGKENVNGSNPRRIYDEQKTKQALDALCSGTFESLRQANVSVFGVLLRNEAALNKLSDQERTQILEGMEQMRPLVEGSGSLNNPDATSRRCGTVPIPRNYSAGGLLIARDPVALALQFIIITCGIDGCKPVPLDQKFEIERGVKRFQVLTTAKRWTLKSPDGKLYSPQNAGLVIEDNAGLTQITSNVAPSQIGVWEFNYEKSVGEEPLKQLLLYSGLGIQLDSTSLVAGAAGKISGKLTYEDGSPVDLSVYGKKNMTIEEILGDGSSKKLVGNPFEPGNQGGFEVSSYTPTPSQSKLEIRVTFNPSTQKGQELAPVSISTVVAVNSPDEYPRLLNGIPSVRLSDMKGNNPATGELRFQGPKTGNGQVCFSKELNLGATILSDAVSRANKYKWEIEKSLLDSNNCLSLSKDEIKNVKISVSNDVQGESEVKSNLPLQFKSEQKPNQILELPANVEFSTFYKKVGEDWIRLVLFALGILLPLAFSYALTYMTTKLTFGPRIQRAEFPVMVSNRGIMGADKGSLPAPTPEEFKLIPSQKDTRKYKDSIGTMRARVSKLVFKDPWFEIASVSGSRVITIMKSFGKTSEKRAKRFENGAVSQMRGNVEEFWALAIRDIDLPKNATDVVPAKLVIYKRNDIKDQNQHLKRMSEVTTTSGIWQAVMTVSENVRNNPTRGRKKSEVITPPIPTIPQTIPPATGGPGTHIGTGNTGPETPPLPPVPPPPPPPLPPRPGGA